MNPAREHGVDAGEDTSLRFGDFRVEPASRRLFRGGHAVALPPKAFDLLLALASANGKVIEKEALMRQLWPDTFVSEESLTQCVSTLRRTLGDDPGKPAFISTVPRRGYRFIATVHSPKPPAPEPAPSTPHVDVPAQGQTTAKHTPSVGPDVVPIRPRSRLPLIAGVLAAAAVGAVIAAVALQWQVEDTATPTAQRFVENAPPGTLLSSGGTLSPDGSRIAYVATDDRTRVAHLWLRTLTETTPRQLANTMGASRPFWSPAGNALGFFAEGRLKVIALDTGTVRTLANVGPLPVGGSWSRSNVILFADRRSPLQAINADGSGLRTVTTLDRAHQESAHRFPYFLPDGDSFLFYANSADMSHAGTYLGFLSGAPPRRLLEARSGGTIFAEPGYLVSVREGRLLAHPFDVTSGVVGDTTTVLATGVEQPLVTNGTGLSAARNGLLAYGGGTAPTRLLWFDVTGRRIGHVDSPAELHNPALTPDDRMLLASSIEADYRGTWQVDTNGGTPSWIVREAVLPLAARNPNTLVFGSTRASGVLDLYARNPGNSTDTLLLRTAEPKSATHWTADGRYLVFTSSNAHTKDDIWLLPMFGDRTPIPFLKTPSNEMQGKVSPDGRWLAYSSDETNRWEVYLQRFPEGGSKQTISTSGGVEPHWSGDGRSLFFLSPDQRVTRVSVTPGETPRMGRPEPLFQVTLSTDLPTIYRNQYAVTSDGRRFVVDAVDGSPAPITVLTNWTALLPR